jgi:hypothetical protein
MTMDDDQKDEQPKTDEPEEETHTRREIVEIRPKDPSPEINDPEPPKFSIGGVLAVVKKKGLLEAITDDAWGPHVHLVLLMSIVSIIAIIIAIVQFSSA